MNVRLDLIGLLILIADIYALVNIIQSSASSTAKVVWVLVVWLLPVAGFILWFFIGPRSGRA